MDLTCAFHLLTKRFNWGLKALPVKVFSAAPPETMATPHFSFVAEKHAGRVGAGFNPPTPSVRTNHACTLLMVLWVHSGVLEAPTSPRLLCSRAVAWVRSISSHLAQPSFFNRINLVVF